ncbi:MAG TPA: TaqI-like C-terminal specificity domain-containing protein [Bacteroidia bacterium]|nr:TaqI-like C-terminal specificity domain-containing protein [Bacteroidia bacterium]HRS58411.1 TaqI-like C-terminal specificity domain-containing protein [Bacteroidia bacterium]HRU67360.1 TaqI-like C-terminal specificity domain-containing protein [Bacteroidia bacterium]
MKKNLTLMESARQLGVSSATILNWEKQGYLNGIRADKGVFFSFSEIVNLQKKIESGLIGRLNSRANKKNSNKTFIPDEHFDHPEDTHKIKLIYEYIIENQLNINESIFSLCLNHLISSGLLLKLPFRELLKLYNKKSNNINVIQELNLWQTHLDFEKKTDLYQQLLDFQLPEISDPIGVIYQSLTSSGEKSKNGSFYTPKQICDEMAGEYLNKIKGNAKILDLCCGSGQFLLAAGERIKKLGRLLKPTCLWGYDIDPVAVQIARINLMILFSDFDFNPNIYQRNFIYNYSLDDHSRKYRKFDLILGNPPWGAEFRHEQLTFLKEYYPEILSMESYSYFIFIGLNLLQEGGYLSYLLPESILNIKTHKDIRAFILKNAEIRKIKNYNRVFSGVFSPVVRIDLEKKNPEKAYLTSVENGRQYFISPIRFLRNDQFIFDIHNTEEDVRLLEKIWAFPHITLTGNADWVLGIVTGDNSKFLAKIKKKGYQKILKGVDIQPFRIKTASNFIFYDPSQLQQASPLHKFKAKEKLIYRFISNRLVFAYDTGKHLTLNSANAVIPKLKDYPMKVIACLFNSELYQFIFRQKYFTHKVLRSHLESLPLPVLPQETLKQIEKLHDRIVLSTMDEKLFEIRYNELNQLVYNIFQLNENEIQLVRKRLK